MDEQAKFSRINYKKWFGWLVIFQLVAWTVIPALVRPTLPHDVVEGIAWGSQWQLGYNKHPPLAGWLTAAFTHVFGVVGWPVYLLAQIAIVIAFWAIWKLANRITTPLYALIGVFSLEGIIYFNRAATKFTPDTVQTPIWALMMLLFFVALIDKKTWQWIVLGLLAGLAVWGKYQAPLLFISMIIVLITTKEGRASFKTLGPYLTAIISIIVVIPHFIWSIHHGWPEIGYALNSTTGNYHHQLKDSAWVKHLYFPYRMTMDQLGAIAGMILMFIPFFFGPREKRTASSFTLKFLFWMALGPMILTLLYSVVTGSFLIHRWCMPYFSALGLWAIISLRPKISWKKFKWFMGIFLFVTIGTLVGRYAWLGYFGPYLAHDNRADAYYPAKPIATYVTNYWHKHYHSRLQYVSGSHYMTAYLSVYSKDKPIPLMGFSKAQSDWVNLDKMRKAGAMFAWHYPSTWNDKMPPVAKKLFPRAKLLPVVVFYKLEGAKKVPIRVGMAVLPPEK
jgi:4-amino-4-deoxy-L-arabinose transferase-like glycosyltransferase